MKRFLIFLSLFISLFFSACGSSSSGSDSSTVKMEIGKTYEVHPGDTLEKTSPSAVIVVTRTQENQNSLTKVVLTEGTANLILH